MTNRNDILNELKELGSNLSVTPFENVYTVPNGYFEGFASQMLARVKAMDAVHGKDELNHLSPFLNSVSKTVPFTAPAGYFDGLEERMMNAVRASSDYQTTDEELESLSPLLKGLKKENPYKVPQGYFENLTAPVAQHAETRVVSMISRKWFRYAAAAIMIGVIAIVGVKLISQEKIDPNKNSHAWVEKNVKKVSSDKIEEFIKLTEKEKSMAEAVASADKTNDIKEFLKDVPENEIQDLLKDVEQLDDSGADDILLNE
jgi:hypothetical protein